MGKSKDEKLNKRLKVSFIIFLIVGVVTLAIILNKGVIFGKRLIAISDAVEASKPAHVIQIVSPSLYLKNVDDSVELSISIDGEDVEEGYELTSSDEAVVVIEGNTAKAVGLGTAVITAKSTEYDIENTVTLDVVVPAIKVTLSAEFKQIDVGEQSQISYKVKPNTGDVTVNMVYETSDKTIATVDDSGIVTGVSSGTVTITGTDKITGYSDTVDIQVN